MQATLTETRTLAQGPAVLRPRQLHQLLNAPDKRRRKGKRDAALLAVLSCGLRVGEATRLTVSQVELAPAGRVRLIVKTSKAHDGRWRTVTMPSMAGRLLREHLDHAEPKLFLFEGHRHEAMTTRNAQRIVGRYLQAIGRSDLHCHSLRHTFGAMVVRATGNIYAAQKLLGHSSPATTARYYAAWDVTDANLAADALDAAMSRRGRGR